jgi:hypothetical protein
MQPELLVLLTHDVGCQFVAPVVVAFREFKTQKNATVRAIPEMAATSFVRTLMPPSMNSSAVMVARPTGISFPPMWKLSGTFHSRAWGHFIRQRFFARFVNTGRATLEMPCGVSGRPVKSSTGNSVSSD